MTDPSLYERVVQLEVAVKDLKAQIAAMQHEIERLEGRIWWLDRRSQEKATEKKPSMAR